MVRVVECKGLIALKVIKKTLLQTSTDLIELDPVLAWFDRLNQPFIPIKVWLQCQLALAEGFTNAVRHAHRDLPSETPIAVEVTLYEDYLEIRVWDQGQPFDLEQRLRNLEQKVDDQAGGGRGIVILQKIADFLSYTREGDRNCLLIRKHYFKDE